MLLVVVCLGIAGVPAVAQAQGQGQTNGSNTTAPGAAGAGNGTTNGTGNGTGAGGGGGLGVGMPSIDFPSPTEMAAELVVGFATSLGDGAASLVDIYSEIAYTLSAPGEPDDPSTWFEDQSGLFDATWVLAGVSWSFAWILYVVAISFALEEPDPRKRQGKLKRIGKAILIGQLPGLLLAIGGYHLTNTVALAIAPDGQEFLQTPGNLGKLGIGLILPVVLVVINAGVVIAGVFALIAIYVLVHLVYSIWSLAWALTVIPSDTLQHWGRMIISVYALLPLLTLAQVWIMRMAFEADWNIGVGGDVSAAILGMLGTSIFLAIGNLGLPIITFKKAVPAGVAVMGTRASKKAGGEFTTRRQQVQDRLRGGGSEQTGEPRLGAAPSGSGPTRRQRTVGGVGSTGGSADGSTTTGTTGSTGTSTSSSGPTRSRIVGGVGGAQSGGGPGTGYNPGGDGPRRSSSAQQRRRRKRRVAQSRQRAAYDNHQR